MYNFDFENNKYLNWNLKFKCGVIFYTCLKKKN